MNVPEDLDHVVVLFAEDEPAGEYAGLAARNTRCAAYHVTPAGEDRDEAWDRYLDALALAGRAALRYDSVGAFAADVVAGHLPEVSVLDGLPVAEVLGVLKHEPGVADRTLLAVALGGGDTLAVEGLGDPGALLLVSPWSRGGWVSEEVCDHTSLLQLLEWWTGVRAVLPAWRRRLCGDLTLALDLREGGPSPTPPIGLEGRRPARPVPYVPWAEIRVGTGESGGVTVLLANAGPFADRAAHFLVTSAGDTTHHTVPGSPWNRPKTVEVELPAAEPAGEYDVTVLGPNGFRRRFAGPLPGPGVEVAVDHYDNGNPAYPRLDIKATAEQDAVLTLTHRAYASGTQEQRVPAGGRAMFRMNPWVTARGWYDLVITAGTGAGAEGWVREYAGHTGTGNPSVSGLWATPQIGDPTAE